jgi:guanylate kinase
MSHIYIISAPSGAGKSSLVAAITQIDPLVSVSISHTTRPPREGEQSGREYHFVTREAFQILKEESAFLEWAEVYGYFYGTSWQSLQSPLKAQQDVILEIDWQGAQQVKKRYPESISVFIRPPSLESLQDRLEKRGKDSPDVIQKRLKGATEELSHAHEFDYVIINENFDEAVADLLAIIRAQRCHQSPP